MLIPMLVKMGDEVTVSSLPHPFSMFFLGIFAVTIIVMFFDVRKFRKDNAEMKNQISSFNIKLNLIQIESENKITEISKKIDSRVDKAILSMKKQNSNKLD